MDSISWVDTVRASVSSCLPCFPSSPESDSDTNHRQGTRRPPANLESLLADTGTDTEGETVSLHSNLGDRRNQRRKQRKKRVANLTLFGYDLFGKRPGAIQLENEDEDALLARNVQRQHTQTASSSYTFDSDAAPLDSAVIDQMSPEALRARAEELEAREAEERALKDERRRKRRERKEVKRLAEALAKAHDPEGDFEGFQGSGADAYRGIPSPLLRGARSVSGSEGSESFTKVHNGGPADGDDEADAAADLDGQLYTRNNARSYSGSGRGSDSRQSASDVSSSVPARRLLPPQSPTMSSGSASSTKKTRKTRSSKISETTSESSRQAPSSLGSPVRNSFEGFVPKKEAFPSSGLGRPRIVPHNSGAFLARRGDDLDDDIHGL